MRKTKRDRVFVVIKEPGKPPRKDVIDNRFEAFQEIIGGYYEPIRFSEDVIIICNEDGKRLDLAENSMGLVGTFLFIGTADEHGEFTDVSSADEICEMMRGHVIPEAVQRHGKV